MSREILADHSWIADVLSDIGAYAAENNLKRLQAMVAETRTIAQEEIIARRS